MFTINLDDNVGIGTMTPNEKLTVEGVISMSIPSTLPTLTTGYGKLFINDSDNNIYYPKWCDINHKVFQLYSCRNYKVFEI